MRFREWWNWALSVALMRHIRDGEGDEIKVRSVRPARIIALSQGRSWEDYPNPRVKEIKRAYHDADIVIDSFGEVVKDRFGVSGRPATKKEIAQARTV